MISPFLLLAVFVEYKGYIIARHKNNTSKRNFYNLSNVFKIENFLLHGYFVGDDDSKPHGQQKMHPNISYPGIRIDNL